MFRGKHKGWGGRAKWWLGALVVAVAVVPSLWLTRLEQQANARLVDEVERGLRSDAVLFADRLAHLAEQMLIEEMVRPVLDGGGYVVVDTAAPGGAFYRASISPGPEHPVAYPFFIDFADTTVFAGRDAPYPSEPEVLLTHLATLEDRQRAGALRRGFLPGPYGPFHYIFKMDTVGVSRAAVLRGVKIDPRVVQQYMLPGAFIQLRQSMAEQREGEPFPGDLFGFTVQTPDTLAVLSEVASSFNPEAVGTYLRPLTLGGVFPEWTLQVHYLNELKDRRWRSYVVSFLPLVIVVLGVAVAARMAMRASELNYVKTLFVSNVSHELKTPLTKINLFNELLQGLPPTASEKRERYHRVIRQETERLAMLVDNVLNLGRIERGQMNYEFVEVPIGELVAEVVETFRVIYEARGYDAELEMETDLPVMQLDPGAVKQALINLTDNAVKYSKEPHTLRVKVRRVKLQGQPAVEIAVTDQGVGIPKDKRKLIFEEFYRVGEEGAGRVSGSGLGLALVQHIVQAHGGKIEVESKVGVGSTFTISLPVVPLSKRKTA